MYVYTFLNESNHKLVANALRRYVQLFSLFKIRPYDIVTKIIRAFLFIFRAFYLVALPTSLSLYNIQDDSAFFFIFLDILTDRPPRHATIR